MRGHLSFRSGNPALTSKTFKNFSSTSEDVMTLDGTVNKIAISLMPRKINTCRAVVNSDEYKNEFKRNYPKIKFDARKEAQNLHKLVTEKRHQKKLLNTKWYTERTE